MNRAILVIGLALVLNSPSLFAQDKKKIPPAKEAKKESILCMHDCGSSSERSFSVNKKIYKGEKIRGPRTVVATDLSPLRYSYRWQSEVTFSAPPDLWSKLTNIASPQGAQGQAKPPTANPTTPKINLAGQPARAQLQKPGGAKLLVTPKEPPISAETIDLLAKADKALSASELAKDAVNRQLRGIDQPLIDGIDRDFQSVSAQVVKANTATNSVSLAGQELIAFLSKVDPGSTYSGIVNELSNSTDFKFMAGVNAVWPDIATITALQNSADMRKAFLNAKKTAFDSAYPSLLTNLSLSERDLQTAQDNLETQALKLRGSSRATEQSLIDDTLEAIKLRLDELDGLNGAKSDLQYASETITWAITQNNGIETSLSNLDPNGDKYKAFQAAQAKLFEWNHNMLQVKQDIDNYNSDKEHTTNPFSTSFSAGCDYTFASTKQNAIKLTQIDNLPDKTAAAPVDVISLVMECASPFNVSAGVEFSAIPTREFAIQPVATPPGSTTTTNEFVLTSKSNFHPLPIGMVSTRLCEPNEFVSFHLSFGVSGNFNSQNAGGSSAEFLIGPSIAFFRTMFLTPGLHIGKKSMLGDGFVLGDPVPPNITTPPIQTGYRAGFGFAITFTKP
jgi:hypothetical protein